MRDLSQGYKTHRINDKGKNNIKNWSQIIKMQTLKQ
jgi:hypothetical protein